MLELKLSLHINESYMVVDVHATRFDMLTVLHAVKRSIEPVYIGTDYGCEYLA